MKRLHVWSKPTPAGDLLYGSLDDLFDDVSSDWRQKAERMQRRAWRRIKQKERAS